jgi:hypothetical protein
MTNLIITVDDSKKRLKFTGDKIALGERVAVEVVGIDVDANTRLRVLVGDTTIAIGGEWNGANCELNLFTVQAEKIHCGYGRVVLDDPEANKLYGIGELELLPWPKERGKDVPYDLGNYPDVIEDFRSEIKEKFTEQDSEIESALRNIEDDNETFKNAQLERQNTFEETVNANVANKADASALEEEITARENADNALSERINTNKTNIETNADNIARNNTAIEKEVSDRVKAVESEKQSRLVEESGIRESISVEIARATARENEIEATANRSMQKAEEVEDSLNNLVKNAPEALDTLEEIANYIKQDETGTAAILKDVASIRKDKADKISLEAEVDRAKEAESALSGRVKELEENSLSKVVETKWADLRVLHDNSQLMPGMQYRITDYVATTVQERTQSANHPFDIIVTADSTNKLNEVARAIRHEGDDYFPETTKFEAWKIWYSLDNDTDRFVWADSANGKGVIYRMIDEFNNDIPYDFKGIKMRAFLGRDMESDEDLWSEDYRYTFGVSVDDTLQGSSYSNTMKPQRAVIGVKLYINANTFGSDCYANTFGSDCYENAFGSNCFENTFSPRCFRNTFGWSCGANIFSSGCTFNTFNSGCFENAFGPYCFENTFGLRCCYNAFGSYCCYNTFSSYCDYNTFSSYCFENAFSSYCCYNTFSMGCSSNTLSDFFEATILLSSVSKNTIDCTEDRGEYGRCKNIEIKSGVISKEINIDDVDQSYHTEIRPENSITISI